MGLMLDRRGAVASARLTTSPSTLNLTLEIVRMFKLAIGALLCAAIVLPTDALAQCSGTQSVGVMSPTVQSAYQNAGIYQWNDAVGVPEAGDCHSCSVWRWSLSNVDRDAAIPYRAWAAAFR